MIRSDGRFDRPASQQLHPAVYRAVIGCGAWLAVAAWGFFGRGYSGLALAVVSLFVFVAVSIPYRLWRIRQKAHDPRLRPPPGSLSEWLGRDFEIWEGREKAGAAVTEILLPIVAAAVGMTLFVIIFHRDAAA